MFTIYKDMQLGVVHLVIKVWNGSMATEFTQNKPPRKTCYKMINDSVGFLTYTSNSFSIKHDVWWSNSSKTAPISLICSLWCGCTGWATHTETHGDTTPSANLHTENIYPNMINRTTYLFGTTCCIWLAHNKQKFTCLSVNTAVWCFLIRQLANPQYQTTVVVS